jgi:hypothetical protein
MKIPEWLPDTDHPKRPEGGSTEPMVERLAGLFTRFLTD